MKKTALLALAFAVLICPVVYAGPLTDKESKLIASGQTRFERTYNLRDMRPNQFSLKLGLPLMTGVGYSYNINEAFAIGGGIGTVLPGLSADLNVTWYIMPTTVAPYVTGGIVYYSNLTDNIIAGEVSGGVDVCLDNGLGLNLGLVWVKSVITPGTIFKTAAWNNEVNTFSIQGGLNIRM